MGNTKVCGSCTTAEVCVVNGLLEQIQAEGIIRCRHYREGTDPHVYEAKIRTAEDINMVSKELKRLYEEAPEAGTVTTEEKTVCGICGKDFSKAESEVCASCGRIICPDCTVISADENKALCEDCFN